jgi:hypothetical protein
MTPPDEPKRQPPHVPRWPFIIFGAVWLCFAPIPAIFKGQVLHNVRGTNEGAIRAAEEPLQFWLIVSAMFFFGLLLIVIGIVKRGKDA